MAYNYGGQVCCLAGAARMPPAVFLSLNIFGTAARLAAIRGLGVFFPEQVAAVLVVVEGHKLPLLGLTVGLLLWTTMLSSIPGTTL